MPLTTEITFNALNRPKAYEQVAQAIREQVFAGALREGQKLPPERELAEQFGVSRAVVREAIHDLYLSGIVKVRKGSGGGTFVSAAYGKPLSATISNLLDGGMITLEHLFQLRLMLEPPAARIAAESLDGQGLKGLKEIVARSKADINDSRRLRETNLEFHRRLVEMAGNPLLSALCETVIHILIKSLEGHLSMETSQAVFRFHEKIVQAIEKGQGEKAEQLTVEDLAQLHKRYQGLGIEVKRGLGMMNGAGAVNFSHKEKSGRMKA